MTIEQISIHGLRLGMVIAEDIHNDNAQLLVPKGATVNERILDKLIYFGIKVIPVYSIEKVHGHVVEHTIPLTHSQKIKDSEAFKEFSQTYSKKAETFKYELNDIADRNKEVDVDSMFAGITDILSNSDNTYSIFDMLNNMMNFDDSTYAHSLNVAMIVNILGRWLKLSEDEIKVITVAGMLHDVGKLLIPQEIITKPGKLTNEEYEIIKQHTVKGYRLLIDKGVDDKISMAALMHHEKCDGSGYPLGIKGDKITEFAKMITVVDIYEAMTANRVYRDGVCPFEVIRLYENEGFQKYDTKYLLTFLRGIVDTYINNTVLLSDGNIGEIVLINSKSLSNPIVKVGTEFIDLASKPNLNIIQIM